MKRIFLLALFVFLVPRAARADDTDRSAGWQAVTNLTTVAAMATPVLMPRIFYSDPETTVGWKTRWHVSVLASTMTLTTVTLLNESAFKPAFQVSRPGCSDKTQGAGRCQDYELLSSQSFAAFSAVGQGTATFLVDTMKWSDGRFNVGGFLGEVGLPLVLGGVTAVGRGAGNWESGGTVLISSGAGLVFGALTGLAYALLQRPECPWGSGPICW